MNVFRNDIRGIVWDWGDTLMRDIPGQVGPMVEWPRVEAMPGASDALEALARYPIHCVASNATESDGEMIAEALERVGLRQHFSHFFTSSELGVSKPDPGFFEAVAREVGVPPRHLLSVGDNLGKDILPAKAAGMATILVSAAGGEETPESAADLVVLSLRQLETAFRSWILSRQTA